MRLSGRLTAAFLLACLLVLGVSPASAAPSGKTTHWTDVWPWALTRGQCAALPSPSVEGTAYVKGVDVVTTAADGSTTRISNVFARGVAYGDDGMTYRFMYHNHAVFTTPASGSPVQVAMTDSFVLNGAGGDRHMKVGFVWRWTFTPPAGEWPPVDNWEQVSTIGDPMNCDPI